MASPCAPASAGGGSLARTRRPGAALDARMRPLAGMTAHESASLAREVARHHPDRSEGLCVRPVRRFGFRADLREIGRFEGIGPDLWELGAASTRASVGREPVTAEDCGSGVSNWARTPTGFDSCSRPGQTGFREFLLKPSLFVFSHVPRSSAVDGVLSRL